MQQLKTEYTSLWESYQQVQLKYNKIYDERVRASLAVSRNSSRGLKTQTPPQHSPEASSQRKRFGTFVVR